MSELSDEILDGRAEWLARPRPTESVDPLVQLLRLNVAGHHYALRGEYVEGVLNWADWTRVPGAPARVLGVLAWRGAIVPVLDLASMLGHVPAHCQHAVVLQKDARRIGVAVTQIDEVLTVPLRLDAAAGVSGLAGKLLEGILPGGVALLRTENLLDHEVLRAL